MDPGLVIVVAVLGIVALMGVAAWRMRRVARARLDALRSAPRIEIEIISQLRAGAIAGVASLVLIFGFFVLALALGEWGRSHALWIVVGLIAATPFFVTAPLFVLREWQRVGRLVLDDGSLVLEQGDARTAITLADEFALGESVVPPGQRIEVVVIVRQARSTLVFRYPVFLGDDVLAPEGTASPPIGTLLGHEARAIHERLRDLSTRSRA
ncbi:hypothetical protein [Sandaracinus amylolyticus]|uniref:Integral membrane protein n=1 Tax=Sandaracinus amylolyticus TaxID=927083 RepID=A0A0F6W6K1_9BACT|nr:hypothetical protein [Sandaracinus amylolyticus]AKF08717.1 hypothetical protein DB32_005866 [Sandaracinus amylolyticus]